MAAMKIAKPSGFSVAYYQRLTFEGSPLSAGSSNSMSEETNRLAKRKRRDRGANERAIAPYGGEEPSVAAQLPAALPRESTSVDQSSPQSFSLPVETAQNPRTYAAQPPTRGQVALRTDMVQFVQMPKSHVNHTYRNFSNTPIDASYTSPNRVEDMSFHEKIYHVLSSSNEFYKEAIQWCPHGRAFEIVDNAALTRFGILRAYFESNTVTQFRKQLHNHGYKQHTTNPGRKEAYYSEFLLRGFPHLLCHAPPPTDSRHLLSDPLNEPDFIEISRLYPLPGQKQALVVEARWKLRLKGIHISDHVFQEVSDRWSKK